jgi:hypothetical protein
MLSTFVDRLSGIEVAHEWWRRSELGRTSRRRLSCKIRELIRVANLRNRSAAG